MEPLPEIYEVAIQGKDLARARCHACSGGRRKWWDKCATIRREDGAIRVHCHHCGQGGTFADPIGAAFIRALTRPSMGAQA